MKPKLSGIVRSFGLFLFVVFTHVAKGADSFPSGVAAYEAGNFEQAAQAFQESSKARPAAGTFQNLGNAEWKRGHTAEAILAWEQARLINPYDANSRNNLKFARDAAQLEAPALGWHEVASTWLPAGAWAWIGGGSLWLAVGLLLLPGIFRWRKASWHQAVAALCLGIFLLSIPANAGVITRARIGFVTTGDTPLRLTPTANGEAVTRLAAGEPARWVRARGNYVFIRTSHATGWIRREQFDLVAR